jgi:hypothetical protein
MDVFAQSYSIGLPKIKVTIKLNEIVKFKVEQVNNN